jgi:hypothetical protein
LTAIFETAYSKTEALDQLRHWMQDVRASGLTCFDAFLKLLETDLDGISNYFREH